MRAWLRAGSLLLVFSLVGCGGNPSGPSDLSGSEIGVHLFLGCSLELDGYRCTAREGGQPGRDVTGFARWSTSDSSIATVNSVGFVTVLKSGEVAIRAEFQGAIGSMIMQVEPGGLRRYFRALSGFVKDADTLAVLSGVRVEILDGANAGRSATTGNDGAYQLYDLQPGTFVVRFTRSGYATADRAFTLPGDRFNSLDVNLTK